MAHELAATTEEAEKSCQCNVIEYFTGSRRERKEEDLLMSKWGNILTKGWWNYPIPVQASTMLGNRQRLPEDFFHPLYYRPPRMAHTEAKRFNGKEQWRSEQTQVTPSHLRFTRWQDSLVSNCTSARCFPALAFTRAEEKSVGADWVCLVMGHLPWHEEPVHHTAFGFLATKSFYLSLFKAFLFQSKNWTSLRRNLRRSFRGFVKSFFCGKP